MNQQNRNVAQLARVIRANGVFSAGSGVILAGGSPILDSWIRVHGGWLIAIGVFLIGYGVTLYRSSRTEEIVPAVARFATVADLVWVGGAAGLITLTDILSTGGETTLAVVSVVVLVFAIEQIVGLAGSAPRRFRRRRRRLADKG